MSQSPEGFACETQFHSLYFSVHFCLTWIHGIPALGNLFFFEVICEFFTLYHWRNSLYMCVSVLCSCLYIYCFKIQLLFLTRTAIKWFYVVCQLNLDFWIWSHPGSQIMMSSKLQWCHNVAWASNNNDVDV